MYIVTGPGTVLGFNSQTGEYKIIGTGKSLYCPEESWPSNVVPPTIKYSDILFA